MEIVVTENPHREQQQNSNRRVDSALLDEAERAVSMAETYSLFAKSRLPDIESRNTPMLAALQEYLNIYRWPQSCGWNESALMERCVQTTTSSQIREILERSKPNVAETNSLLRDLSSQDSLPKGKLLLRKEDARLLDIHQSNDAPQDLSAVTIGLYEVLHADILAQLRAELSQSDVQRARIQRSIDQLRQDRDQALALGDMPAAEGAHKQLIDAHYEMCELCAQRVDQVHSGGDDDLQFQRQMADVKEDAVATYGHFEDHSKKQLAHVQEDIQKTMDTKRDEEYTHDKARGAFAENQARATEELDKNLETQHQLIAEIQAKIQELANVCDTRKGIVEMVRAEKTREEQRIASYSEFVDLADQHLERLKQLQDYLSRCATMADAFNAYKDNMLERLGQRDMTSIVSQLAKEESERFLAEYRAFVYSCGELSTKKMHRFDTLERQVRLTKHNLNTAVDSLDPNIHKYNSELDQLVAAMRDTEGSLTTLQASQDSCEQLFKPAEAILRANYEKENVEFVHPLNEYGTKAVEDRRAFVERALRFVEDEEREVAKKREGINKMKAATALEHQAHQSAVRTAVASPSPLFYPNSPSRGSTQ